ncbi:hypothetical protein [Nocardia fluminea]|uniref:hypothetical protein n=1 Tax=Nocardia fluminea TaxID=134984 RepID=UPI003D0BFBAA
MSMLWVYPAVAVLVLFVVLLVKLTSRTPRVPRPHGRRNTAQTAAAFTLGAVLSGAAMTLTGFAGSAKRR